MNLILKTWIIQYKKNEFVEICSGFYEFQGESHIISIA